jgi:phospholipase/carboxylesterase
VTSLTAAPTLQLDRRPGDPPRVTDGVPHIQLTQNASQEMIAELAAWAFSRPGVVEKLTVVGNNALGLTVAEGLEMNSKAILGGREFGHIHTGTEGGSLHLKIRTPDATEVVHKGWGEWHPVVANMVMVYAPRDAADLEVVRLIIEASRVWAIPSGAEG